MAGHVSDGTWESPSEYGIRVSNNNFRVIKYEYKGEKAGKIREGANNVMKQTGRGQHIGAPKHFGLNANAVRLVNNFSHKLSLHLYNIGNGAYPIPGGCANAVASILVALGLIDLVPNSARFAINNGKGIDLGRLAGISVPIVMGKGEYKDKEPTDQKLKDVLNSVPLTWGKGGERIEFIDPNYWHPRIPDNKMLKKQFKNRVQLAVTPKQPYPDRP